MKRRATKLHCAALAVVAGVFLASSCYRAEIDLKLLQDSAGGQNGASGAASDCDDTWVDDAEAETCRQVGYPTHAECAEQDPDGWAGCYDGGCSVCTVGGQLPEFPYYFTWHVCCEPNDVCSNNAKVLCNSRCPPPTEHDRVPPCGKR